MCNNCTLISFSDLEEINSGDLNYKSIYASIYSLLILSVCISAVIERVIENLIWDGVFCNFIYFPPFETVQAQMGFEYVDYGYLHHSAEHPQSVQPLHLGTYLYLQPTR